MDVTSCLQNVVGLSNSDCACFDTGKPIDFNESESGFYMATYLPLNFTNSAADCEQGGVWDILETARTNGVNAFVADIPAVLASKYDQTLTPYLGWVGSPRFNSAFLPETSGNYTGLRYTPAQIKGGKVILRGVELALDSFTAPIDVDVLVYSNIDLTALLGTATVTLTSANKFFYADFATPIEIELSDKDASGYSYPNAFLNYYIVYQMPTGARYVNNLLFDSGGTCCGNKPQSRQYPFLQYGQFEGIENPTILGLEVPSNIDSSAKGLRLKADYGCSSLDWLCGLTYDYTAIGAGNYADVARCVATAILQKSIEYAVLTLLNTTNVNSFTILNREQLLGKLSHARSEYAKSLAWLKENFPTNLSDCFKCKQSQFINTIKI